LGSYIICEQDNTNRLHFGLPVGLGLECSTKQGRHVPLLFACECESEALYGGAFGASVRLAYSMVLALALGNREASLGLSVDSGGIRP
jgi:hypothetical protein